jgi:hypothetical protein
MHGTDKPERVYPLQGVYPFGTPLLIPDCEIYSTEALYCHLTTSELYPHHQVCMPGTRLAGKLSLQL